MSGKIHSRKWKIGLEMAGVDSRAGKLLCRKVNTSAAAAGQVECRSKEPPA